MPIALTDIRNAVIDYLNDSVTTSISTPVADTPDAISPSEGFTFNVTATNAAAPTGVKLVNVVYHLKIASGGIAKLQVPMVPIARSGPSSSDPILVPVPPRFVTEMYLFPPDNVLEVGDTDTISVRGKANDNDDLGQATITFEVYADVDLGFVFPRTTTDPDSTRLVTVT